MKELVQKNHSWDEAKCPVAFCGQNSKMIQKRYYRLEHHGMGKVDMIWLEAGDMLFSSTDVERMLRFKYPGRYTRMHFKKLKVRLLPIPHPGNPKRLQYKNFVDVEGVRKLLDVMRKSWKVDVEDASDPTGWIEIHDWLVGFGPGEVDAVMQNRRWNEASKVWASIESEEK